MSQINRDAVHFSKLAYRIPEILREEILEIESAAKLTILDSRETDTQGFVVEFSDRVVVAFRGTELFKDKGKNWWKFWKLGDDIKIDLDKEMVYDDATGGKIHRGFRRAFDSIVHDLAVALKDVDEEKPIHVFGHSLGGAIAIQAAYRIEKYFHLHVERVRVLGCPKIGDALFAAEYNQELRSRTYRYINCCDIVSRIPFWNYPVGQMVYVDSTGHEHRPYVDSEWVIRPGTTSMFRFLDRIKGRIKNYGNFPSRGVRDHFLTEYEKVLG